MSGGTLLTPTPVLDQARSSMLTTKSTAANQEVAYLVLAVNDPIF